MDKFLLYSHNIYVLINPIEGIREFLLVRTNKFNEYNWSGGWPVVSWSILEALGSSGSGYGNHPCKIHRVAIKEKKPSLVKEKPNIMALRSRLAFLTKFTPWHHTKERKKTRLHGSYWSENLSSTILWKTIFIYDIVHILTIHIIANSWFN